MNPRENKGEMRLNRRAASKQVLVQYRPVHDHYNLPHLLIKLSKFSVVYVRGHVFKSTGKFEVG